MQHRLRTLSAGLLLVGGCATSATSQPDAAADVGAATPDAVVDGAGTAMDTQERGETSGAPDGSEEVETQDGGPDVAHVSDGFGDTTDVQALGDVEDTPEVEAGGDVSEVDIAFEDSIDVEVTPTLCAEDEYVSAHTCVACPAGATHPAGGDASGDDTVCEVPALRAGGPGAAFLDPYEEVIALPACDAADPEVRFITEDADWDGINNDGTVRVFCVAPGDYRAVGKIELTVSGEPSAPRVIRIFDPADPTDETHPVKQTAEARAIIQRLRFVVADHWIVDGLSVLNNDPDSVDNTTVELGFGASYNVLQRLLVEGGTTGVRVIQESNHNLVQRCVIRDMYLLDKDTHCVTLTASGISELEITGNRFVSNEISNCSNGIQLHINDGSDGDELLEGTTFPGTVIANNDLYLTPERYTDCDGNLVPDGPCAAGEMGIGLKGGGTSADPAERVHITRNRVWGWRKTDMSGLGGSGSWGPGVAACCFPGEYVLFDANVISDCARGLGTAHSSYMSVIDNVVANIEGLSTYDTSGEVLYAAGHHVELYRNIFVGGGLTGAFVAEANDYRCNTVIGMTKAADVGAATDLTADYNAFFGLASPGLSGANTLLFDSPEDAHNDTFCFERRILTGPETHCIDGAQPTLESPHLGFCDPALGSVPGVGIDDELFSN